MIKKSVLIITIFLFTSVSFAKDVFVRGYTRKNGTYVAPYTRSSPSPSTYKSESCPSQIISVPSDSVKVGGYARQDGTYIRPHYRSAPDDDLSNNYGKPSYEQRKEYENSPVLSTYKYDYDNDGLENRRDSDDDNDGVGDNYDNEQYNEDEN